MVHVFAPLKLTYNQINTRNISYIFDKMKIEFFFALFHDDCPTQSVESRLYNQLEHNTLHTIVEIETSSQNLTTSQVKTKLDTVIGSETILQTDIKTDREIGRAHV